MAASQEPEAWGSMPEDVCKTIVRHIDSVAALARFGTVCTAWQQVKRPRRAGGLGAKKCFTLNRTSAGIMVSAMIREKLL